MKDYGDYKYYAIPVRPLLRKRVKVDVKAVVFALGKRYLSVSNLVCHLNEVHAMPLSQAREEVARFIHENRNEVWFRDAQRTSEVFISRFKDDSRNDRKAKRCAVMNAGGFWVSHINLEPEKFPTPASRETNQGEKRNS